MNKQILKLFGIVFFSIMTLSISSCGEDPVEDMEEGQEQVDDEKESNPIVGTWVKKDRSMSITLMSDNTGYVNYNDGVTDIFKYTYNSRTSVVTITEGHFIENEIGSAKVEFIDKNTIKLGWWNPYDEEWFFESDEIYYRQS